MQAILLNFKTLGIYCSHLKKSPHALQLGVVVWLEWEFISYESSFRDNWIFFFFWISEHSISLTSQRNRIYQNHVSFLSFLLNKRERVIITLENKRKGRNNLSWSMSYIITFSLNPTKITISKISLELHSIRQQGLCNWSITMSRFLIGSRKYEWHLRKYTNHT